MSDETIPNTTSLQAPYKPLRNAKGQLLPGQSGNPSGRPKGWRAQLRDLVGDDIPEIYRAMVCVAKGQPIIPRLPDGREGAPIVPTAADVIRAGTEITHQLGGRPVSQAEIVQAEAASDEMAAIRDLSDEQIQKLLLERGFARLEERRLAERFDKPSAPEEKPKP